MGLAHSPKIVTDGLVFAYDMGNTDKSWRGKPTVNLANVGLNGMVGVSLSFIGVEDGWKKYSMSGTFTNGTYPYTLNITSISFTGGVTYSSSCFVRTNVMSKFTYFGNGMNYVNVPMNKSGTSFGVLQPDGSYYCGRSNFEYTGTTTQTGYILSNPINNTTFNAATDFVWIKNGQIEQGEFPTPFAGDAGTRSNTQSVLDQTNNNIVTANSLTYASNGTFSFNGANNYVTIASGSNFTFGTGDFTLEAWYNPSVSYAAANGYIFDTSVNGTRLQLYNNNLNFVLKSQVASVIGPAGVGLNTNTWHHAVGTRVGSTLTLYLNGVSIGTSTSSANLSDAGGTIGVYGGFGPYYFNGQIPIIRVYKNKGHTAAEVRINYNALRGRFNI